MKYNPQKETKTTFRSHTEEKEDERQLFLVLAHTFGYVEQKLLGRSQKVFFFSEIYFFRQ
jgi:hypothetical protein